MAVPMQTGEDNSSFIRIPRRYVASIRADLETCGIVEFMGSGDARVAGDFLASQHGPAFNLKVAIRNTDLPSMNDILRAYGRFDVAAGKRTVFRCLETWTRLAWVEQRHEC